MTLRFLYIFSQAECVTERKSAESAAAASNTNTNTSGADGSNTANTNTNTNTNTANTNSLGKSGSKAQLDPDVSRFTASQSLPPFGVASYTRPAWSVICEALFDRPVSLWDEMLRSVYLQRTQSLLTGCFRSAREQTLALLEDQLRSLVGKW